MATVVGLGLGRGVVRGVGDGVGHKKVSRVRNGADNICAMAQSQCLKEDFKNKLAVIVAVTPTSKRRTQSRCQDPKTAMSQVRNGAIDDSLLVPTLLSLFDGWRRWSTGCAEAFRTLGCLYISLSFQPQARVFAKCMQVAHCDSHRVLASMDVTS